MKEKNTSCIARLVVDSPAYCLVKILQSIHKQKKIYDFVGLDEILIMLSEPHRATIRDFENGILDDLMYMQIIEQNSVDTNTFRMHPDHWTPFV